MKRAAQIRITATDAGESGSGYVVSNLAAATSFLADQQTVDFVEAIDQHGDPSVAAQMLGLDQFHAEQLLNQLVAAGVLVELGTTAQPAKPKKPVETRLIFFRLDLLDIGPMVRALLPLLRLPFSTLGFILWAGLIFLAAAALTREPMAFANAAHSLTQLSWEGAAILAVVFTLLKVVHELGHATALWLNCKAEGVEVRTIRAGISFFALFPFPFTDATAAWQLRSRYRRAGIAMAGIYLESWLAAIAAIIWGQIKPGETQTILFQVLVVSGVSTVMFNLNPLVRLDGYYVFSDLAGRPNLATRAAGAARSLGGWLLGGTSRPVSGFHLGYWILSYAYRWVIFAGIFWIFFNIDPRLALPVAVIALISLIGRPVFVTAKHAWSDRIAWLRLSASIATLIGVVSAFSVPVPDRVLVHGALIRFEAESVRARHDVRIASLAASQKDTGTDAVVRMESPTLKTDLAALITNQKQIEGTMRAGRTRSPAEVALLKSDLARVNREIERTQEALAALITVLPAGHVWEPAIPLAENIWVSAHENRTLGRILRPVSPHVSATVGQANADLAETLPIGTWVPTRSRGNLECVTEVQIQRFGTKSTLNDAGLEVRAGLKPADPCLENARAGEEVILYLARPDASIAQQIYRAVRKLAQSRLPVGSQEGSK